MKQKKGYQVRYFVGSEYSKQAGRKLFTYARARKVVKFLKARGVEAYAAPMMLDVSVLLKG